MGQFRSASKIQRRVVITGLGVNTSLGRGMAVNWPKLIAGESGIGPITHFDSSQYVTKVAGEARDVPGHSDLEGVPERHCRRSVRLFVTAVEEAWRQAGLDSQTIPSADIGLAAGTSANYVDLRLLSSLWEKRRPDKLEIDVAKAVESHTVGRDHFFRRQGDMVGTVAASLFQLKGPMLLTDTACSASAHAIGQAFQAVRHGRARAMIAGGSAALVRPISILAFALLGALSRGTNSEASRPFDKKRDGFVMGEGAGAVVLESLQSAQERGARILAEVIGFGATTSAHNLTDPSPNGLWEGRAMSMALDEAGVSPEEIDYVAAHGTSTPKNDANETQAIKSVFGEHAKHIMVSSNKGHIGHTISAAGVCNVLFTVKAMQEGVVPPTINLKNPDPACDLDYVPDIGRRAVISTALCNAFAFGGQNVSLALRAWK